MKIINLWNKSYCLLLVVSSFFINSFSVAQATGMLLKQGQERMIKISSEDPEFVAKHCQNQQIQKYLQRALLCYVKLPEKVSYKLTKKTSTLGFYQSYSYEFKSQLWPKVDGISVNNKQWSNRITIIKPYDVKDNTTALLFLAGEGDRIFDASKKINANMDTALSLLALKTKAIVVVLHDVLNMPLIINDSKFSPFEDGPIARSWKYFIDNSKKDKAYYVPLNLAMVKSSIQSLDIATNAIIEDLGVKNIEKFVVVGGSKRGWTAWLAGMLDNRIVGIMPISINIMNTTKNIELTFKKLGEFPHAWEKHIKEGVIPFSAHRQQFNDLMKIIDINNFHENCVDPISCPIYEKQLLSKPLYMVNGTGDQFFPADVMQLYFANLKGNKALYFVDNAPHTIIVPPKSDGILDILHTLDEINNKVFRSIKKFYNLAATGASFPQLSWKGANNNYTIIASSAIKPKKIKLWYAYNPKKENFMHNQGIRYTSINIDNNCNTSDVDVECEYKVTLPDTYKKGFTSFYLEFKYGEIMLTTEVYVVNHSL